MKTKLLLVLAFLIGMEMTAQIATPRELTPGYNFQLNQDVTVKPPNPNHIDGRIQNSYVSSTFDPAWANRFQTVLDSASAASGVKGVSAAVLVPGQGLWTGVSGISSEGEPVTSEMRFGFASNTKLFIAVTLAKLQEENILSLDDQLSQWLPNYPFIDSTATIRQLLQHQSGFFDFLNNNPPMFGDSIWADTSRFWTSNETLATIGEPHFSPGNAYAYSNTNYLLAGMIIESATGEDWFLKMREIIFEPLLMDSTFVGAFEPNNGPVAHEYANNNNNIEIVNSPMTSAYSMANAAGTILSTPQEMVKWYAALFNGEIISWASLQEVLDFEPCSQAGLGIFEASLWGTHYAYTHNGALLGYLSQMVFDVETKSVVCVVTNSRDINFNSIVAPFGRVFYDEYPKKENDAGITEIVSPWQNHCDETLTPLVKITNFGSSVLSSANINYQVGEDAAATYNWIGSLNPGDTAEVNLPEITAVNGAHSFKCYTSLPNGMQEEYTYNDTARSNFIVDSSPSTITILSESFDSDIFPPDGWSLNSYSIHGWRQTKLVEFNGIGSLSKNNFNDNNIGAFYDLNLPKIHVSNGTKVILDFIYAYTFYPGYLGDSLQILISDDCGATWKKIFNKGGESLRTVYQMDIPFYPQTSSQWKEESLSIETEGTDVLIRIRSICGYGNNLFIDDMNLSIATSVDETILSDNLKVFPNPTTTEVNISGLPQGSEIQLSTLSGRVIMTHEVRGERTNLKIDHLPRGVYILRTVLGVKKIVKM